jgi:DNA invertase Pin-like site-specific DNA recombinase
MREEEMANDLRVSTRTQDLEWQERIVDAARAAGYYVASVYREKASGARTNRPELLRMIDDLQVRGSRRRREN